MSAIVRYLRMGPARRQVAREALRELAALRWLGKDPGYPANMRAFGSPRAPLPDEHGPTVTLEQAREARRVGRTVEAVARRVPWEANCVAKALAARAMLERRGIPSTAFVGAKRAAASSDLAIHAWLMAGRVVVTGGAVRVYRAVAAYG